VPRGDYDATIFRDCHLTLDSGELAGVLGVETHYVLAFVGDQVYTVGPIVTEEGWVLTIAAVGEARVHSDLAARLVLGEFVVLVVLYVALARVVVFECLFSVDLGVRLLKQVKLVVVVVVVKEVHSRHLLAHELGEVGFVAAVVAFESAAI
jgi:hypothetical protein